VEKIRQLLHKLTQVAWLRIKFHSACEAQKITQNIFQSTGLPGQRVGALDSGGAHRLWQFRVKHFFAQ